MNDRTECHNGEGMHFEAHLSAVLALLT